LRKRLKSSMMRLINRCLCSLLFLAVAAMPGCKAYKAVVKPDIDIPAAMGMAGMRLNCAQADTVNNILISKAESLIQVDDQRYESLVTVFAVKDSLVYLSAANSGFEILRATMDTDTIRVIDRINKVVYISPVVRRFGYSHPVDFNDVQNLISLYYLCDEIDRAFEPGFDHLVFDLSEPFIKKQIFLDRESLKMDKFEFYHAQTNKYIMGERSEKGIRILSNFMISGLEVNAWGGTVLYNQDIQIKMDVNPRRYTTVNL